MYYGGFLYKEINDLPVAYKRWFIERIVKEINKGSEKNAADNPQPISKALHQNTPELRAMQNQVRQHVPSRLRRFT